MQFARQVGPLIIMANFALCGVASTGGVSVYTAGGVGAVVSFHSELEVFVPDFSSRRMAVRCYENQDGSSLAFATSREVPRHEFTPSALPVRRELTLWFATDSSGFCVTAPSLTVSGPASGPTVSVKDFGAVGDGIADDYKAMRAAALSVCQTGGTLIYPAGTYYIGRYKVTGGINANGVGDIIYDGCNNVMISGYGAQIVVDGAFDQTADYTSGGTTLTYESAVMPFSFVNSHSFWVLGFTIDGGVRQMSRDSAVVESPTFGIRTRNCSDFVLADLNIHHFQTDGICIGCSGSVADRNAYLFNVASTNNARMGLTIAQAYGVLVDSSRFECSGCTDGAYTPHAPQAGVDVEPTAAPPRIDRETGALVFVLCRFAGSVGSQFVAVSPRFIASSAVVGSIVDATAPNVALGGAYANITAYAITDWSTISVKAFTAVLFRPIAAADYGAIQELALRGNRIVMGKADGISGAATAPLPGRLVFNELSILASAPDNHVLSLFNLAQVGCNAVFASATGRYRSYRDQLLIDFTGTAAVVGNSYSTDLQSEDGGFYIRYGNDTVDAETYQDPSTLGPLPRLATGQNAFSNVAQGGAHPVCSW